MHFYDRQDAGLKLSHILKKHPKFTNAVVIGLARGGVAVAFEIAKELSLPMHVVVPRKIGAPGNRELAIGSIMASGEAFFNEPLIRMLGVSQEYIDNEVEKEKATATQRLHLYRQKDPLNSLEGKTVLLVDDGIATGYTMLSAIKAIKNKKALKVIVVVPVASTESVNLLAPLADEIICPYILEDFISVGSHYHIFNQVEDEEVIKYIESFKNK